MKLYKSNSLLKDCFVIFITCLSFSTAYSQSPLELKEIDEAVLNSETGNYQQAIPILEKYASKSNLNDLISLKVNVYLNISYLSTNNQAFDIDKVNNLIDSYIFKNKLTKTYQLKSVEEIDLIYMVGIININYDNFKKSFSYLSLLREIYEENDLINPTYLQILRLLIQLSIDLSDFKSAVETGQLALKANEAISGEENEVTLNILDDLFYACKENNQIYKAEEYLLKRIEIGEKILGRDHAEQMVCLNNLASFYFDIGNYQKALEITFDVLELKKKILGEKHPDYLNELNNLTVIYSSIGDYLKAIEINEWLTEQQKTILGENHPNYINSLNNLAQLYSNLGDFSKAIDFSQKVVNLRKEILGEEHPEFLLSLGTLSSIYSKSGDYKKAINILQNITEKLKESFGKKSPEYLTTLNNLAYTYSKLHDYSKALGINQEIVEIRRETLGLKHPDYLTSLNNLALNYSNIGEYQKALEIYMEIEELSKSLLGENHPNYLKSLGNLAGGELDVLKINSAYTHYNRMLNLKQKRVVNFFSMMTEHQRTQFWNQYNRDFSLFPRFLEMNSDAQLVSAGDAYNHVLFTKGLLLNTTIDFEKLIAESGTPEAIAKFEELKLLKLQIQRLQERPLAEQYLNVDSLENIAQKKESELVKLSKEYGDYTRNLKITWEDVQANLSDNDVAIEFIEYPTLSETVKYAALVLRNGWQYPKMISLFRKDQIEEFIKQDEDKIYSYGYVGKQMKKLLWEPLAEFISPGERVYFSPAGIIHQLAIENLAWNDSTILGERYQMYRLSSTKELVVPDPELKSHSAVVYGGLDFDLELEDMVAGSKKFETPDNLFTMLRGYSNDYSERSGWNPIYGTGIEAEQINRLLSDKNYQVNLYNGKEGIEESFKSLSGKENGIIHIATHGFFLPIEESRENPFVLQRIGDEQPAKATIDPMLRSGLIMAGGNKAWLGEDIPDNIEDGVLTAKEISHVDLRGTDMVVLSACETALGEISSEGVFGLQRSFKQAGVKTIVMSLWKVNDEATRYMMTEFYASLLSGKEKREAFLEAKQKCRKKYIDPQYWAAFIMLN